MVWDVSKAKSCMLSSHMSDHIYPRVVWQVAVLRERIIWFLSAYCHPKAKVMLSSTSMKLVLTQLWCLLDFFVNWLTSQKKRWAGFCWVNKQKVWWSSESLQWQGWNSPPSGGQCSDQFVWSHTMSPFSRHRLKMIDHTGCKNSCSVEKITLS